MKPLNSGHLRVLKNLAVIERCPLSRGNLKKTVTFGTKCFVRCLLHVRYLGCPLSGFLMYKGIFLHVILVGIIVLSSNTLPRNFLSVFDHFMGLSL